ncbi:MAG: class I SAM-dependent methyltransferase [Gammaproteobacteria bacterium]|nr:class I SAM-dependent methyltransferase [Gammaproteobacteria bacterium]
MQNAPATDRTELERRLMSAQQEIWFDGDYGRIGITLQITGERLMESMDLRPGESLLDIASGNGNAALAAARRHCQVTATDFVPDLLGQAQARAAAEHVYIEHAQVDAQNLPYAAGQFDNVCSTFGVMFAPHQAKAARELLRVCRPGGRIGLANWTPEGYIGRYFQLLVDHIPLPSGIRLPTTWGTREFMAKQYGERVGDMQIRERTYTFRYRSPEHWFYVFSTFCGLTLSVFKQLDAEQNAALRHEVLALIDEFNRADDGTMVVESSYLECVITK